ncbi:MAG: hypothetical protein ACRD4X_14890 [Candidatus Acidiferrales bacterium]
MTVHLDWGTKIECKFDGDPRLLAGAAAIVAHMAQRAGLAESAATEISSATMEACTAILQDSGGRANPRPRVQLSAAEFPDHIEVSTQLMYHAPNVGHSQQSSGLSSDLAERLRQALKNSAVDGVDVEVTDGIPHITLVKNCGAANRRFAV